MNIALVGDYNEQVPAHRAIPLALQLAGAELNFQWVHSDDINRDALPEFSAFWCVPASPYSHMNNVLSVIEYARSSNVPFLGTCGGYQHAALEFALNALGYAEADNAEVNPQAGMPLISALSCKLYSVQNAVKLTSGSLIRSIYRSEEIREEYNCGYGVNPEYLSLFEGTDMSFTGYDDDGDPRALEVKKNTFFVGTAFQPERSAFSGAEHPLIRAFVECAKDAG